jgi:hypothetical protein
MKNKNKKLKKPELKSGGHMKRILGCRRMFWRLTVIKVDIWVTIVGLLDFGLMLVILWMPQ